MASITSFYYAIFKKLQAVAGGSYSEHLEPTTPAELSGGFSLKSTTDPNGIKGVLSPAAVNYHVQYPSLTPGWSPLVPGETDPFKNPLYVMLFTALTDPTGPDTVTVNGQEWPVMPPPWILPLDTFTEFNTGPVKLVEQLGGWIAAGQIDDAPKNAPLEFNALTAASAQLKALNYIKFGLPIVFVCSMPNDAGPPASDGAMPAAAL